MAKLKYRTISKRTVDALPVEDREAVFWDDKLPGFGVRVYPSGSKVYVVQTRHRSKSRRVTLGRHGVLTADGARREAALAISRIKSGQEPVEKAPGTVTVAELAARYLREHVEVRCKESTQRMYRSVVERFIVPAYGHVAVEEVEQQHIAKLHFELRGIPYQANRALEIGVKLFNLAEEWRLRTGGNPCRFVRKYRETKRERFLTDAEFRRLGEVLEEMEAEGRLPAHPAAAIRLLMLTGCRRNEIVELEWKDVDLGAGELRLRDSKSGARLVPLSPAAARVLAELPRVEGNPWVIPGTKRGRHLADLNHYWERVRERAELEEVRLHDLRHSFASRALALGESLSMIGKLLGHNKIDTTSRYAHLARDSIKASSARVADSIGADILTREARRREQAEEGAAARG
ncbi:MAG: site-specific integrase [Deltaproteobacteria bacterium]|nr:site-specific integrase [Deltaproteobacteria bacterium]